VNLKKLIIFYYLVFGLILNVYADEIIISGKGLDSNLTTNYPDGTILNYTLIYSETFSTYAIIDNQGGLMSLSGDNATILIYNDSNDLNINVTIHLNETLTFKKVNGVWIQIGSNTQQNNSTNSTSNTTSSTTTTTKSPIPVGVAVLSLIIIPLMILRIKKK